MGERVRAKTTQPLPFGDIKMRIALLRLKEFRLTILFVSSSVAQRLKKILIH
jgi:hypothetical protein